MECGNQRLSIAALNKWENLKYGMFIHFGISTFLDNELPKGDISSKIFAPDKLDVEQWVSTACNTGMKYAVLTAKHVSGHCLWPSRHTSYHVETSNCKEDIVGKFVQACHDYGIMPGLYYCSWDNHHLFGSETPNSGKSNWNDCYVTDEYLEFQWKQIEELMTDYSSIGEIWIDIPKLLPRGYRHKLYNMISRKNPDIVIVFNNGLNDGSKFSVGETWPTDVITIERNLPDSFAGHKPWRIIEGQNYYIPAEMCDTIGRQWFFKEGDILRSDEELLGMYLLSTARGSNFLLDVPPDRSGQIPQQSVNALVRLAQNIRNI